jgi:hypothetical protein
LQYYAAIARENTVFVIVTIGLFIFIAAFSLRLTAPETIHGQIEALRIMPTDEGGVLNAFVRLEDETLVTVRLPKQYNCKPGRRIAIQKSRTVLGYRYNTTPDACL